jgi:alpha-maltose-1-phosphate synthase
VVDGDPAHLGPALRDLLADPAAADAMGRRGAEAATRQFGWAAVAAEMERVYLTILTPRTLRERSA